MKVRVSLTIEVDPQAWNNTYGCGLENVREDIKSYVLNNTQGSSGIEESDATVTLN